MFSAFHILWVLICVIVAGVGIRICIRRDITTRALLRFCCYGAALSEVIKVLSVVQVVPNSDGSAYYPYLQLQHMPFHLCSLMIGIIFWAYFTHSEKTRDTLLQLSYPICIAGGVLAILIPTIFTQSISVSQAFTHPLAYQYFLYHSMLIVLAVRIARDQSIAFSWHGYGTTMKILGGLALLSIYLNSLFSVPVYDSGQLVSVEYGTNLMFTSRFPMGFTITTKTQWLLYLAVLALLACSAAALIYLPLIKARRKAKE